MITIKSDQPPKQGLMTADMALALIVETACEQFEVLRRIVAKEVQVTVRDDVARWRFVSGRAEYAITMALAKSFVANVVRARRICEHGAGSLKIDKGTRVRFLKGIEGVLHVRDVNEHGLDVSGGKATSKPLLHLVEGGYLDETSMFLTSPDKILLGPLNLNQVYEALDRIRDVAGFSFRRDPRWQQPGAK